MSITSVAGNTPNSVSHSCTTSFDFTLNIFRKQVSTTYWRDKTSDLFVGHTSRHFSTRVDISCRCRATWKKMRPQTQR